MIDNEPLYLESPKFLLHELKRCQRIDNGWKYEIKGDTGSEELKKIINFNSVYLEGYIDKKPCDEVMILRDCSGRVKLSNCTLAVQNSDNDVVRGAYCSVTGELLRETGLPEISAQKITRIKNSSTNADLMYNYWPAEVRDFQLFILVSPNIDFNVLVTK